MVINYATSLYLVMHWLLSNVFSELIVSEESAEDQLTHWKYETRGMDLAMCLQIENLSVHHEPTLKCFR